MLQTAFLRQVKNHRKYRKNGGYRNMAEYKMTGAELASMLKGQLKSNMLFNGIIGVDDPSLHLTEEQICWWRDAKIGLFVHWGVFSVIGKGEWAYFKEGYTEKDYRKIAEQDFHPARSAEEITSGWTQTAKNAGMRYAVMVTRHHDGFALWDSKASWKQFTSAACGPKADYVKAFTKSCAQAGLYTGLYYSPMDWRFPGYFDPKGKPESAQKMKEQAYQQLCELCTQFGDVRILWYDGGWLAHQGTDADAAWFWDPIRMNKMIRALQPGIMVTPRSGYKGDFECDEGPQEVIGGIVPIPWEKCMTLASAWGYQPNDTYCSFPQLIRMLANVICRDGNLLLNVGPDAEGEIPQEEQQVLAQMGAWLQENGEAVYGTRGGIWQPVDHVYGTTWKDHTVYVHVLDCHVFAGQVLPPVEKTVCHACLLDGTEVPFTQDANGVRLQLPEAVAQDERPDTIIKVSVKP